MSSIDLHILVSLLKCMQNKQSAWIETSWDRREIKTNLQSQFQAFNCASKNDLNISTYVTMSVFYYVVLQILC